MVYSDSEDDRISVRSARALALTLFTTQPQGGSEAEPPPSPPRWHASLGMPKLDGSVSLPQDLRSYKKPEQRCCFMNRSQRRIAKWVGASVTIIVAIALLVVVLKSVKRKKSVTVPIHLEAQFNYTAALAQSLFFFDAQKSGVLPASNPFAWRGDSALNDGADFTYPVDLTQGYYDAGDSVKFVFPLAYAMTVLAWGVREFPAAFQAAGAASHVADALEWGTDWLMKAHTASNFLFAQVGDAPASHACWVRPEDMSSPRNVSYISAAEQLPGADLAGEAAAALAAAAVALKALRPNASRDAQLLYHAEQLLEFSQQFPGKYSDAVAGAQGFYTSSGFFDEQLWGAVWLYLGGKDAALAYAAQSTPGAESDLWAAVTNQYSWDEKTLAAQVLLATLLMDPSQQVSDAHAARLRFYQKQAEAAMCQFLPGSGQTVPNRTTAGLLWWSPWSPIHGACGGAFVAALYGRRLHEKQLSLQCIARTFQGLELVQWAQSQADYILGKNPLKKSYMVGFGSNYPQQPHHRGASIPEGNKSTCGTGEYWLFRDAPSPNLLLGAFVGGPNQEDELRDNRTNYQQMEPSLAIQAPCVALLAAMVDTFVVANATH